MTPLPPRRTTSRESLSLQPPLRRPASHDSLGAAASSSSLNPSRPPLNHSASSRKRRSLGSDVGMLAPRPLAPQEPTLLELMRAEERRLENGHASLVDDEQWEPRDEYDEKLLLPPQSAVLHPPLYGRPGPSPSPDIFAELLKPLLSLSRPASPAPTPPLSSTPSTVSLTSSPIVSSNTPSSSGPSSQIPVPAASSLPAHFPPRTPSDPGPTVESQGFVLYLGSLIAWWAYLIWGFLPEPWLEALGIHWFPSREWALLVPAWTIMLAAFVYFSYIALNIFITPSLDSLHTITDTQALVLSPPDADVHEPNRGHAHPLLQQSILLPDDAVPPLHDLPLGLVNRVVFGDFRRRGRRKSISRDRDSRHRGMGLGISGTGGDEERQGGHRTNTDNLK